MSDTYVAMTKSDYAFNRLREDILSGELPSGSKLIINDLAAKYGISAMPIRSAVAKLEEIGYVRSSPHVGAWVNKMEIDEYFSCMLIRTQLESTASMITALVRTDDDLSKLEALTSKMGTAYKNEKPEEYAKYNRQFHSTVYHACQDQMIIEQLDQYMERTLVSSFFLGQKLASLKDSYNEQLEWMDAIKNKDAIRCYNIVKIQRTRFNLSILQHIKDGTQEASDNNFLNEAMQRKDLQKIVDHYIKIFKSLQESIKL